ncbi:family 4 glycosyl hydrolase [Halocatena marina]|uniref:family 4 glycosyl hydrolase n=1 Tax=Halocatena marina TaxID=2934937 RepID=UPI00200DA33B|nr:glycoside hydrolase family 4 [Halocatena marina]
MGTSAQQRQSDTGIDADEMVITYIGGGSRQWAPKFVQDMALSNLDGEARLYDVNYESAQLNSRFGNWVQDENETTGTWTYRAVKDLDEALAGADAVITSTQFDPTETFVHDLDIPKRYGIHGAVAATIGPGGIMRAMRTIPLYRAIAAGVREQCPDAWVFNFTNPVHFVTRALYDEYPDINAVGLCHEVMGTRFHLARIAEEHLGMNATHEDITLNVKGINHFTWVDEAYCKGVDLWPVLEELADSEQANQLFTAADLEGESVFVDNQQITWELFRRFDMFPAAGDRHLVEYANWFLHGGEESLNRWGIKRTGSDYRAKHWTPAESKQTTDVTAWLDGEKEFELEPTREVFADMLEALAGGDSFATNVNMVNTGQVSDIEEGAVVETNALVRANEIRPLSTGGFPRQVRSMINTHVDTIETIIEASRTGDIDEAFKGFLIDPQIRTLSPEDSRNMFAELISAEKSYLDDWKLDESTVLSESATYE